MCVGRIMKIKGLQESLCVVWFSNYEDSAT